MIKELAWQCTSPGLDPWSEKIPEATEQLSPCATSTEPVLWSRELHLRKLSHPRARALPHEEPLRCEAQAAVKTQHSQRQIKKQNDKETKAQELCSSAPRRKQGCKICRAVGKVRLNPTKQWVGALKQMAFFFFFECMPLKRFMFKTLTCFLECYIREHNYSIVLCSMNFEC